MLAGGALAGVVADFAGADLWLQIVGFCVVSLLMIGFVRPVALKHLHKGPADRRTNIERLIGESALVMEAVSESGGLVKIGGDVWSARSEPGRPGARPAGRGERHRRRHRDRCPAAGIGNPIGGGKLPSTGSGRHARNCHSGT